MRFRPGLPLDPSQVTDLRPNHVRQRMLVETLLRRRKRSLAAIDADYRRRMQVKR